MTVILIRVKQILLKYRTPKLEKNKHSTVPVCNTTARGYKAPSAWNCLSCRPRFEHADDDCIKPDKLAWRMQQTENTGNLWKHQISGNSKTFQFQETAKHSNIYSLWLNFWKTVPSTRKQSAGCNHAHENTYVHESKTVLFEKIIRIILQSIGQYFSVNLKIQPSLYWSYDWCLSEILQLQKYIHTHHSTSLNPHTPF